MFENDRIRDLKVTLETKNVTANLKYIAPRFDKQGYVKITFEQK